MASEAPFRCAIEVSASALPEPAFSASIAARSLASPSGRVKRAGPDPEGRCAHAARHPLGSSHRVRLASSLYTGSTTIGLLLPSGGVLPALSAVLLLAVSAGALSTTRTSRRTFDGRKWKVKLAISRTVDIRSF